MTRRHFLQASLLAAPALLLSVQTRAADTRIAHINDAINKSGRQRMLSPVSYTHLTLPTILLV